MDSPKEDFAKILPVTFWTESRRVELLHSLTVKSCYLVTIVTLAVLGCWTFSSASVQAAWPIIFVMKANTAVALLPLSFGVLFLFNKNTYSPAPWLCFLIVSVWSSVTIAEQVFSLNLGIDQLFAADYAAVAHPGRTSVPSALWQLAAATIGILHLRRFPPDLVKALSFSTLAVPLSTISGYLYHAPGLTAAATMPIVSVHTAICQLLISLSLLGLRIEKGATRVLVSDSMAGSVARKLIPLSLIVPIVAGSIFLLSRWTGIFSVEFAFALLVTSCALFFAASVWFSSTVLWKTEKTWLLAENRFRQLAETMPQIVWSANAEGSIDYYNEQWFNYIQIPDRELMVKMSDYLHDEDRQRVHGSWQQAVDTGSGYDSEFRLRDGGGAYRWFLCRAIPVKDERDAVLRWFGTCTDVEDFKKLEEQRETVLSLERTARVKAEEADQMKDEFLATLSHELRTPLNAISGWSQVLAKSGKSAAEITEGLAIIQRNARAQKHIIDELLDMNRIVTGKMRLHVLPLSIDDVTHAAVESIRPRAQIQDIEIVVQVAENIPAMIGDSERLQQILWNLLRNAVRYTPNGGKIALKAWQVEDKVHLEVSDTGEGIRPDFLPYVFDRFKQADSSTTRRHGGLGLGLALVKQLVEMHGGSVSVTSAGLGKGASFLVALPLVARLEESPDFRIN